MPSNKECDIGKTGHSESCGNDTKLYTSFYLKCSIRTCNKNYEHNHRLIDYVRIVETTVDEKVNISILHLKVIITKTNFFIILKSQNGSFTRPMNQSIRH
jgi:hypothetical protein